MTASLVTTVRTDRRRTPTSPAGPLQSRHQSPVLRFLPTGFEARELQLHTLRVRQEVHVRVVETRRVRSTQIDPAGASAVQRCGRRAHRDDPFAANGDRGR